LGAVVSSKESAGPGDKQEEGIVRGGNC